MKKILFLLILIPISNLSCKDKNPRIPLELQPDMLDYFVNFNVGTKWIYTDTLNQNIFDTITLISKVSKNFADEDGISSKGFVLGYAATKSLDFKVDIHPGINKSCYVRVFSKGYEDYPIDYEYFNGKWNEGVEYKDSIIIKGNKYYNVLENKSLNSNHGFFTISKNIGMVYFFNSRLIGRGFILIKIEKP